MPNQDTTGILDQFQTDLVDAWPRLPNKVFFFVLLAAWLALFQFVGNSTLGYIHSASIFNWTLNSYSATGDYVGSDDGHGILVPFVVLALFWAKRKQLLALPLRLWWPGLTMLLFCLLLHLAGYMIQQPRVSLVAFFLGLYSLMGLAWGRQWLKESFFPFWLFALCVPVSQYLQPITFGLRLLVTRIVEVICHTGLGMDVVRNGTQLMNAMAGYQYDVAAACSGIRSLVATIGLAVVFAMLSFRHWWKRGVMVAAALPLAVLGNVIRLMSIVIAAEFGGQNAGHYVHDGGPFGIFSLLPYVLAFVGLMLVERWLKRDTSIETRPVLPAEPKTA